MLTRDEIPFGNINDVRETALALCDVNMRLKDNIDGWKAVMKKTIGVDAADAIKGLEAENARLREELTQRNSSYLRLSKSASELSKHIVALEAVVEAAEMLWVVLANVSEGNWDKQNDDWKEAACRWRDNYFAKKAALEKVEGK